MTLLLLDFIQFTIKLPVLKEKCSYLYNYFVSVQDLETLFPSLNEGKNYKIFLRLQLQPPSQLFFQQITLACLRFALLKFLICNDNFPIFELCRFFLILKQTLEIHFYFIDVDMFLIFAVFYDQHCIISILIKEKCRFETCFKISKNFKNK